MSAWGWAVTVGALCYIAGLASTPLCIYLAYRILMKGLLR